MSGSQSSAVWVDILCLASLAKILRDRSRWPIVHYFNISRPTKFVLPIVRYLYGQQFRRVDSADYVALRVGNRSLIEQVNCQCWNLSAAAFGDPSLFRPLEAFIERTGYSAKKVRKHFLEKLFLNTVRPIETIELAMLESGVRVAVILKKNLFSRIVSGLFADTDIEFFDAGIFNTHVKPRDKYNFDTEASKEYLRGTLYPLVRFVVMLLSMVVTAFAVSALRGVSSLFRASNSSDSEIRIGVYYARSHYVDPGITDLYWLPDSGIEPHRVTVMLRDELDACWHEKLKNDGLIIARWLTNPKILLRLLVHPSVRRRYDGFLCPPFRSVCRAVVLSLKTLMTNISRAGLWMAASMAEFQFRVEWHSGLFRSLNMRLVWNMEAIDRDKMVVAQAMELNDGFKMGSHGSYYPMIDGIMDHAEDVFFTWSKSQADDVFCRYENEAVYVVGYPFDSEGIGEREITESLLSAHAGKFRLAYMDTIQAYDTAAAPYGHRKLWEVFSALLEANDNMVLLWKPKHPTMKTISDVRDYAPKIDYYLEKGRIDFITGKGPGGRARPAAVAKASHLAVGVGLSSAAIECYLAGTPALNFDPAGFQENAFFRAAHGIAVFDDPVQLQYAIESHIKKEASSDIELMADAYAVVDSYRDGQAYRRTGRAIRFYLEELARTTHRNEIHETVRNRLISTYGNQLLN